MQSVKKIIGQYHKAYRAFKKEQSSLFGNVYAEKLFPILMEVLKNNNEKGIEEKIKAIQEKLKSEAPILADEISKKHRAKVKCHLARCFKLNSDMHRLVKEAEKKLSVASGDFIKHFIFLDITNSMVADKKMLSLLDNPV